MQPEGFGKVPPLFMHRGSLAGAPRSLVLKDDDDNGEEEGQNREGNQPAREQRPQLSESLFVRRFPRYWPRWLVSCPKGLPSQRNGVLKDWCFAVQSPE